MSVLLYKVESGFEVRWFEKSAAAAGDVKSDDLLNNDVGFFIGVVCVFLCDGVFVSDEDEEYLCICCCEVCEILLWVV